MSDTMPLEIRKIAEETQRIEDEIFKKPPTPEEKVAADKAAAEKVEADRLAVEKTAAEAELTPEQKAESEKKAAEEKIAQEAKEAEEAAAVEPETDAEKSDHKYKVLQGKYNKELPREREARKIAEERAVGVEYENSQLRKQIVDLTSRLEKLEKGDGVKKVEDSTTSKSVTDTLNELETDPEIQFVKSEFPDVWKGFKKALAKTYGSFIEGTASKITKVEEKIKSTEETAAKTSWMNFNKHLDDNVEGWRIVNKDPEFHKWLDEEEEYSGVPKKILIKQAIDEMDGPRVGKFFIDFAKTKTVSKKDETVLDEVKIDKPVKDKDGNDIMPPKGQKLQPPKRPADNNTEIITQEHIADFYDKKRRGYYVGREAEGDAEEKRIEKAVVECRVR